jgi:two-component system chemotaxis response regulator CheY
MTQLNDTMRSDPRILDLPPTLEAENAAALIEQMNAFPQIGEIRLNAMAVTSLSPGYLQILISAFKTFPQLSVSDASAEFVHAFASCGVDYPRAGTAVEESGPIKQADAEPEPDSPASEFASAGDLPKAEIVPASDMPEPEPVAESLPEPPPAAASPAESAATPVPAPKTILTIDDSRTMRDMLNMALSGAGFTVVQAVDGQDGLTALARQPVDMIITDINMPKLDGYGVIRAVRSDPAYNATPIFVLSTEGEQESKDIAKDAGATGWIVKPFDPDGLVTLVNRVCG